MATQHVTPLLKLKDLLEVMSSSIALLLQIAQQQLFSSCWPPQLVVTVMKV